MVIKIPLTQGKFTIIDDEDYDKIKELKFYVVKQKSGVCYARYTIKNSGNKKGILHRIILNVQKDQFCDHINGDGLDNRRCNLRIATKVQNAINSHKYITGVNSKYKGVSWDKKMYKWVSRIKINNKQTYLGAFSDEIQAAKMYDLIAIKTFGEYARLNFDVKKYGMPEIQQPKIRFYHRRIEEYHKGDNPK